MAIMRGTGYALVILGVCFSLVQNTFAMMCENEHPQNAVCRASFVIKAKILDTAWTSEYQVRSSFYQPRIIRVQIRKIFKGSKVLNATKHSQLNILYASPDEPDLKVGHTYVLTGWNFGPMLMMNLCNWHSLWGSLTTTQRLGIERSYYMAFCQCLIRNCNGENCYNDKRSCPMEAKKSDCRFKSHLCMSWNGRCRWANPDKASTC